MPQLAVDTNMLVDVVTDRLKTKISLHSIYSYLHSYWGFENDRLFLKKIKKYSWFSKICFYVCLPRYKSHKLKI